MLLPAIPKGELFHHVVDEVDGIRLRVPLVDLQHSNSVRVIDGRVLVAPYRRSLLSLQREELHVYLHMVARNLLLVAMCMHGTSADSVRKPAMPWMALADPIDCGIRGLGVVQDLFNDLIRCLVGVLVRTAALAFQPLVTEFAISVSPFIERGSCHPEVQASLVDVPDPFCILENPLLAMNYRWSFGPPWSSSPQMMAGCQARSVISHTGEAHARSDAMRSLIVCLD